MRCSLMKVELVRNERNIQTQVDRTRPGSISSIVGSRLAGGHGPFPRPARVLAVPEGDCASRRATSRMTAQCL